MTRNSFLRGCLVVVFCFSLLVETSPCVSMRNCPSDWELFEGQCFYTTGFSDDWINADKTCRQMDAHLPRIKSKGQNDFLYHVTEVSGEVGEAWLDLSQDDEDTPFKWVDGSDTNAYENWSVGEPSDKGRGALEEDCAAMKNADGTWVDVSCFERHQAVCQKQAENGECASGWTISITNTMCYIIIAPNKFATQKNSCMSNGGTMVTIFNANANNDIRSLLTGVGLTYIGLFQDDEEDEFSWSDGTVIEDGAFENWRPNTQPSDTNLRQDCAVIGLNNNDFWYDQQCNLNKDIVCQKAALCILEKVDPTWSGVSSMQANVDQSIQVTCQAGKVHPRLRTSQFTMECNANAGFMFCDECVDGCDINLMYAELNLVPLEQHGLLNGESVIVQCACSSRTADGLTSQDLACTAGSLSPIKECTDTTDGQCSFEVFDFELNNWEFRPGCTPDLKTIAVNDTITVWCIEGTLNPVTNGNTVTLNCGSNGWIADAFSCVPKKSNPYYSF